MTHKLNKNLYKRENRNKFYKGLKIIENKTITCVLNK